jgi:hypothetical protein
MPTHDELTCCLRERKVLAICKNIATSPRHTLRKPSIVIAIRLPVFARSHASSSPGHWVGENSVPQSTLSATGGVWSYPGNRMGTKPTASEASRRSADAPKTSRTSTFVIVEIPIVVDLRALEQRPMPVKLTGAPM